MANPFLNLKIEETPKCVIEGSASLTIDFMSSSGRIYGFPYAYLLHFTLERNPHAAAENASSGQVPLDRFSFFFSSHEVRLLGWRLVGIIPPLRHAKLLSVRSIEPRYYGLSKATPFVSDIEVMLGRSNAINNQFTLSPKLKYENLFFANFVHQIIPV